MIELYKMIHGIDQVNLNQLFIFSNDTRLRRHNYHLKIKSHSKKNSALNFFTRRTLKYWNDLNYDIVNSKSLNIFKNNLDNYMLNDDSLY